MKVKYYNKPVPHIIIENIFNKTTAKNMFNEAKLFKNKYQPAFTGSMKSKSVDEDFRTNSVLYIDCMYINNRDKSTILSTLDKTFSKNQQFREVLSSSPYPISDFILTNRHETQISRYGNEGQRYDWHIDRFNKNRHVTIVYYFNDKQKWSGGELEITNSPIYKGKTILKKPEILTIKPTPNSMVIFGSSIPHRVLPVKSPKKFEDGRFSINCWIGFS